MDHWKEEAERLARLISKAAETGNYLPIAEQAMKSWKGEAESLAREHSK